MSFHFGLFDLLFALLLIVWTLLLPIGFALAIIKRKKKGFVSLGIVLALVSIPPWLVISVVFLWLFDALRGWELRLPVEVPPYQITLVQEPGGDFYESYFEITRPDGKTAEVWIDGDDYRWFNPNTVRKDGRIYFVRNFGQIGDRTSYVDPENDVIFSGYWQNTHKISELDFE